jgi:hypothetical protein
VNRAYANRKCYAGCRGECRCYPDPDLEPEELEDEPERHAWDDLFDEVRDDVWRT